MNSSFDNITTESSDISTNYDKSYAEEIMATARKMHYITSGIIGPILVLLGIIGNVLSIIIWQKKSLQSSTGAYLVAQAVNDIGVLVFFFLTDSLIMLYPELKMSYQFGVFHSYIGYPIFYFFIVNSIWTLVGVTVDRYILVCWVNQSKILCTERAAKTGVAFISFLTFVVNAPHFNTYYPIPNDSREPDEPSYDFTEFGAGKGSQIYEFWVHCMFLVLAPWVSILFMNMAILNRVTKLNRQMKGSRGEEAKIRAMRKENQLTKLLLTVTFTFLLLIAVQCITQCFFMLQPEFSDKRVVSEAFAVAKLGIIINSSINFILYCVSGKRFRKELMYCLSSMIGCRFMVVLTDSSELYVARPRETSMSSESPSNTSMPNTFRRIETPQS